MLSPDRRYFVWIGQSIFGSLSTFKSNAIYYDEYKEYGHAFVDRILTNRLL